MHIVTLDDEALVHLRQLLAAADETRTLRLSVDAMSGRVSVKLNEDMWSIPLDVSPFAVRENMARGR